MDPNEERDGLIEPPPLMLGVDSSGATTSGVDVNEFTGGFQPLPIPPGSPDVPIDVPDPNASFFRAFCESVHAPGTPGCPPNGGLWAGDVTTDLEFARGQMRAHNEMFDSDANHVRAFVAVRIKDTFVPQPDIF